MQLRGMPDPMKGLATALIFRFFSCQKIEIRSKTRVQAGLDLVSPRGAVGPEISRPAETFGPSYGNGFPSIRSLPATWPRPRIFCANF